MKKFFAPVVLILAAITMLFVMGLRAHQSTVVNCEKIKVEGPGPDPMGATGCTSQVQYNKELKMLEERER